MDKYIFDGSNGLWHKLQGDYYIPCLILYEEETQTIGLYGQRHKEYLKEHKQFIYTTMLIEGTLNRYLADINQQAEQMFHRLIKEMAEKQGVTEQVKSRKNYEMDRIDGKHTILCKKNCKYRNNFYRINHTRGRRCFYTSSPLVFIYSRF